MSSATDRAAAAGPQLGSIAMDGVVVIGEGEKDEAPMLYNGERVGAGGEPLVDVAVDPVDGTTLTAKNLPDALAVIALSERGTMFDPGPCVYMEKLVVGRDAADAVDLDAPIEANLAQIARAKGRRTRDLTSPSSTAHGGGFVYTTDFDGRPVVTDRLHWVLTEAIGAAAVLLSVTGDLQYDDSYRTFWDHADAAFRDHEHGSWRHELDERLQPSARTWAGKSDVYYAVQATLIPRLPVTASLAGALLR